jgi:DNA-binding XRE family transcriptional regulator
MKEVSPMSALTKLNIDGKDYVLMPMADYDALRALAEDAEDEALGAKAMSEREAALAQGEYLSMTAAEWDRIDNGESPLRVVREHRGLTQAQLSTTSGIARPEISAIETGARRGTVDTLAALARALKAPLDVIVGDE